MHKFLAALLFLSTAALLSGMSFRSGVCLVVPIANLDDAKSVAISAIEKWGFMQIETSDYPYEANYQGFRTAIDAFRPTAKNSVERNSQELVLRVEYNSAQGEATNYPGRSNVRTYSREEQAIADSIWSALVKKGTQPAVRYARGLHLSESASQNPFAQVSPCRDIATDTDWPRSSAELSLLPSGKGGAERGKRVRILRGIAVLIAA